MKFFISGKITGNPNYKEQFANAKDFLKSKGHIVYSPAVLSKGMDTPSYMRIGFTLLENADAIYLLNNWQDSGGAKVEYEYAKYLGKLIYHEGDTIE